jgi:hypothetical protein
MQISVLCRRFITISSVALREHELLSSIDILLNEVNSFVINIPL